MRKIRLNMMVWLMLLAFALGLRAEGAKKQTVIPYPFVTINLTEGKAATATQTLSMQIDGAVTIFGDVADECVTVLAQDAALDSVLNQIANPKGWIWWRDQDGKNYGIADRETYESWVLPCGGRITKSFNIRNRPALEVETEIKSLLTKNIGSSVCDGRTNKLIVADTPATQRRIAEMVEQLDTVESAGAQGPERRKRQMQLAREEQIRRRNPLSHTPSPTPTSIRGVK